MPGVLPIHHAAAEAMPDQIAAAVVSVVDRSSQCNETSLTPQAFIPHVLQQFAAIASSSPQASHTASDSSSANSMHTQSDCHDPVANRCVTTFMGDVCGRFCRRGYASIVAETCWQLLQGLLQSVHSPHRQHLDQQQHQRQPGCTVGNIQQQPQQPESTDSNEQRQQGQQQHMPEHTTSLTNDTAALSASPEQIGPSLFSQQAACLIIHAVQDANAVDKLLSCLLQSASSHLQHLDRNAALLHTVLHPMWAQGTVRYELLIICHLICR